MEPNELKSALDGFQGAVFAKLDESVKRMDELEKRLNRPVFGGPGDGDESRLQYKAYLNYLRGGESALGQDEHKNLTVASDVDGGYLAPDYLSTKMLKNLVLFSPIRQLAQVSTIENERITLPQRTGTMTAAWVTETGNRQETQPAYGMKTYNTYEASAYVDMSQKLLDDALFNFIDELSRDFGEEFGRLENRAFVLGDGIQKPTGFLTDTTISESYIASGIANFVSSDALIDMFHALKPAYRTNATWLMSSTTLAAIRKLKDDQGQYLVNAYPMPNAPATTILGKPVVEAPDMPEIAANAFPIAFGDFRHGYLIFDRVSLSMLRDPYTLAKNGQVRLYARRRVAGGVGLAEAIKVMKVATS